jgi:acetoin:2,6-dichlorophenolindophenol oxidoreductase subunit alpha
VKPVTLEVARRMYRNMVRIRISEEHVAEAVEAGEIGTPCHLSIGQEAVAAGVCAALAQDDYVWGGHRSHGHFIAKGGDLRSMVAEIFGRKTGCCKGRGGSMHLFASEVGVLGTVPLVAATIPLAAGAAMAVKLRGESRVSVSFFGDGAVEEGHTHETMNLAAVYKLPVLFVCENNLYASHMGLLERRANDNIHQVASFHGMPGVSIDGNDALAVYDATTVAVDRARRGDGPSLLECRTFRWRGHVGPSWDVDVGVRRKNELDEWLPRDPIPRLRAWLVEKGCSQQELEVIDDGIRTEIADAFEFARTSPFPDAAELTEHVFRETQGTNR